MSMDAVLPVFVSLFGTLALFFPYIAPRADDQATVLVFSPMIPADVVLQEVAALNLPIRDIRWNGRLAELDLSTLSPEHRRAVAQRLSVPAIQIGLRPYALCAQ